MKTMKRCYMQIGMNEGGKAEGKTMHSDERLRVSGMKEVWCKEGLWILT